MDNTKRIVRGVLFITGIGALVVAVGFDAMLYVGKSALNRKYETQSDQVADLKHQIDGLKLDAKTAKTAKTDLAQAQKDLDGLRSVDQKMKDSIGAFALQAAACDTLKRTMNVQEPGV